MHVFKIKILSNNWKKNQLQTINVWFKQNYNETFWSNSKKRNSWVFEPTLKLTLWTFLNLIFLLFKPNILHLLWRRGIFKLWMWWCVLDQSRKKKKNELLDGELLKIFLFSLVWGFCQWVRERVWDSGVSKKWEMAYAVVIV